MRGGFLYGIQMLIPDYPSSPIKIGYSSRPELRLMAYNGEPFPVKCFGVWPAKGAKRAEEEAHRKFHKYRLGGEWFYPAPEIVAFIERSVARYRELIERKEKEYEGRIRRARTYKEVLRLQAKREAYDDFVAEFRGISIGAIPCATCRRKEAVARLGFELGPRAELVARIKEHFASIVAFQIKEDAAACLLGVPEAKLKGWRLARQVEHNALDRLVRYREDQLLSFVEEFTEP